MKHVSCIQGMAGEGLERENRKEKVGVDRGVEQGSLSGFDGWGEVRSPGRPCVLSSGDPGTAEFCVADDWHAHQWKLIEGNDCSI